MGKDYHHFKGNQLSRAEKIQCKVVELLLKSRLTDKQRESSLAWEMKHSCSCCQVGRILAEKRGLDVELAEVICVLHDIYVVVKGTYKDHAKLGGPIARKMLSGGDFSKKEIKLIVDAIEHHSEKEIYSDYPYTELAKDADVFDCSLYQGVEEYYKLHKKPEVFTEYEKRLVNVRKELGLQVKKLFRD